MAKNSDCHCFGKGGWCGKYHDEEIELTHKGASKRIVCVRCSELLRRWGGKCDYYKQQKKIFLNETS